MRYLIALLLLTGCMAPNDSTGSLVFRADPSCDGMGTVRLEIDDTVRGEYVLGNEGETTFTLPNGWHTAHAQELQGTLLEWVGWRGYVTDERRLVLILRCPIRP